MLALLYINITMKRLVILLVLTILYNISSASAKGKIIEQKRLYFGKNADYYIIAKENGKGGGDIPQCGPIDIILKKGKKEISRFQSFPIWYNCPLDGFLGITVKGRYFTIEDSYCDIADRVYTFTTFRYDATKKEFVLHRYGESYIDSREPERDIPEKSYLVTEYIPFQKVTAELLLGLKKNFK